MKDTSDQPQARLRPAIVASFIGTAVEWYDFFLFGVVTATVFDRLFFPQLDTIASTLASFGTFAVAFIARPVGGALFGHFGDRLGRRPMLIATLITMAASTIAIGLLPTYETIGVWAPALLVVARIAQGLAVGGEWGGAVLIAVEHAPRDRRGFYGSFPQSGVAAGLALSSAAYLLTLKQTGPQFLTWGWRLPFLASAILLAIGLYVRLKVLESPEFQYVARTGKRERIPALSVIRRNKSELAIGIGVLGASTIPFYIATVYSLSYGARFLRLSPETLLSGIAIAAIVAVLLIPPVAALSDRLGRRVVLLAGAIYMAFVAFPFFWLLETRLAPMVWLAMILVVGLGNCLTLGIISSFVADLFPAPVRFTGIALSYQLGGAVTSGPAPFLAAALTAWAKGYWPVAVYIIAGCIMTIAAVLASRRVKTETGGKDTATTLE